MKETPVTKLLARFTIPMPSVEKRTAVACGLWSQAVPEINRAAEDRAMRHHRHMVHVL